MGVKATVARSVGKPKRSNGDKPAADRNAETYWAIRLIERKDAELTAAIETAASWLQDRNSYISRFRAKGGSIEFYVSLSCDGHFAEELPSAVLERIVKLGVYLSVEVFT